MFSAVSHPIYLMGVLEGTSHRYSHRSLVELRILNRMRGTVRLEVCGSVRVNMVRDNRKRLRDEKKTDLSYPNSPATKVWSSIPD